MDTERQSCGSFFSFFFQNYKVIEIPAPSQIFKGQHQLQAKSFQYEDNDTGRLSDVTALKK